ncbi:deleted in azoospermia-like isoform X3 [Hippoglossus hippoglossus]|uniref:deleted in azoospermia-like isoform X3 n=1 Tax=Hippoglossus hippoglossus TaxID=8267 RepID=UPI00148B8130|nr:deleted in azoospermia-like isoform X3 [Hippoglossus hippoglossus]
MCGSCCWAEEAPRHSLPPCSAHLFVLKILDMEAYKPRGRRQAASSSKLSNGYILPEGRLTPNALFVGGIDIKVEENEIRDFFAKYGLVKEVKIITYRGGLCKGYGFVYFNEEVNIPSIVEEHISFKGRKLKLGPAIMKERSSRSMQSWSGQAHWTSPTQYFYCACCSPVGGGVAQPSPILNGGSPYPPPYSYSNYGGGVMVPQMPMNYPQNVFAYPSSPAHWTADQRTHPVNQSFVDCGVQTMLTVM